jgi:hypothetical protein
MALGRNYARWTIMRASAQVAFRGVAWTRRSRIGQIGIRLRAPIRLPITKCPDRTVHNQRALRNCNSRSDGRNRDALTFGGRKEFSDRSFIPRSASTYICVVVGLS